MARLDLTFGQPATSQITPTTAPTAAKFQGNTSRFSQDQVQIFNNLLTGLLTKAQTIPEEGYNQRSTNLQKAALDRASAITPASQRGLSPSEQSSIRSAQVSAVEQPLQTAEKQRTAFQNKIEKLPSLLSSLSDFSKAFEDEGQKLVSHTFKEDANGNVTWVGVMQNPDGTFEQVSENMGGIGTPTKATETELQPSLIDEAEKYILQNKDKSVEQLELELIKKFPKLSSTNRDALFAAYGIKKKTTDLIAEGRKIVQKYEYAATDEQLKQRLLESGLDLSVTDINSLIATRAPLSTAMKFRNAAVELKRKGYDKKKAKTAIQNQKGYDPQMDSELTSALNDVFGK